jgi:hypothetical protein
MPATVAEPWGAAVALSHNCVFSASPNQVKRTDVSSQGLCDRRSRSPRAR